MFRKPIAVVGLMLAGSVAAAQSESQVEVGTMVGVTILSQSGTSLTHIGIPGDGIQASPTLYATFFAGPSVMIEPAIAWTYLSSGGSHLNSLAVSGQLGYLLSPTESASPYLAANVAFQTISDGSSVSGPAVGGAVGYRFKVRNNLAIRLDARYRRWFSDFKGLNEFGIGLGIGAIL